MTPNEAWENEYDTGYDKGQASGYMDATRGLPKAEHEVFIGDPPGQSGFWDGYASGYAQGIAAKRAGAVEQHLLV